MTNPALRLVNPNAVFGGVHRRPPRKQVSTQVRKHLTEAEIERVVAAARESRHGHRDATAILVAFRHGLRCSELVGLRWEQINLDAGTALINRRKNGAPSAHPLSGTEMRALRKLQREGGGRSPFVFVSERTTPLAPRSFFDIVDKAARRAGLEIKVTPHSLRHSTGFKLANDGRDTRSLAHYLGHKSLNSTAIYTALASDRFRNWWTD